MDTRTKTSDKNNGDGTADLIEYDLLHKEQANSQSWRRATFVMALVAVMFGALAFYTVHKDHTTSLVYKEDVSGDIALVGIAGADRAPTPLAVKHQIGLWISFFRTIPSDDPDLVQTNAACLFDMTAAGSQADTQTRDYLSSSQNPLKLGKLGFKRTVLSQETEVTQLSALTYRIAWKESLRQGDGAPSIHPYSGSVTLAQAPLAPTDPIIGRCNPAGVYIESYDMAWSTL